jgi:hypothetical protein
LTSRHCLVHAVSGRISRAMQRVHHGLGILCRNPEQTTPTPLMDANSLCDVPSLARTVWTSVGRKALIRPAFIPGECGVDS